MLTSSLQSHLTRRYIRLVFASITILLAALAQENSGKILGTVTDTTGAVIPNAKLTAAGSALPRGFETTSDNNGNYQFSNLPIGDYTVTVTATGFTTMKQVNMTVQLGSEISFNPKLSVGQVSETVEVSAEAISLDTTSSRTATNITRSQFESFEHGRNFNSILALAPGVRQEVKAGSVGVGGISVDGASGSENSYILDGVDVSDVRRGSLRSFNSIPFEFVQEVQVKSGGFEAEYGGATGGVINVATRSGTNQYHGQFDFSFTNNQLNAGDRGYWQRSPLNADAADFFRPKEDKYRIFYPGGTVGGPILKNRLFFLASYHPEFQRTERSANFVGAGPRTYTQEIINHYSLARVDYNPFSKLQVNSSWIWSPQRVSGYLPNRDVRIAPPSNDLSVQGGYTPSQAFTASGTYTATSRLVFSVRYGYKYLNDKGGLTTGNYGISGLPYITYLTASSAVKNAVVPADVAGPNGFKNVSSTLAILKDITTRHNIYADVSYIANVAGQQHSIKAGYSISRLSNIALDDYTNGQFTVNWGDTFSRGSINNVAGAYGYYNWEDGVRHDSGVSSRNQGFYIQDNWRVGPRITINAGVRFENEFLPPYRAVVNGVKVANPISFDWGSKIAPRIGAAWDIMGDGKWKLSGSYGVFYDVMKYELARGSFGGDIWFTNVYKLDSPNVNSLSKANPGALGTLITRYDNRTVPINAQGQLDGIDPGIKPYQSREFSVSFDHQLAARMVAGVRYTRKDLLRAIEDIGVLDSEDNEVYLIGNPGFGQTRSDPTKTFDGKTPNGSYLVPKAVRQYDAVEFRLQGQTRDFNFVGSYTWSRLYGNYSGLANSDESGRSDPGVSRAFDLPYYYFDASGSQKNVLGPLGTDRPHTFKLFGSYELKTKIGSTTFGLNQIAFSGTPDSTSVIYLSAPTFPNGRGDLGRTPFYTQTDLAVHHTIKLSERTQLRIEGDARNLFNQAAVISRVTQINRNSAITVADLPLNQFFAGYKLSNYVNPQNINGLTGKVTPAKFNPIYGLPGGSYRTGGGADTTSTSVPDRLSSAFAVNNPNFGAYQDFRVIRLGVRLIF